ncbi:MAG: glutathione S-transferase family protein [Thalassospira sp.]|uniref:glutathione S-transferase family protein n=1 Tax=Thalassospira sp. TaxID=1912094 RepID=UPI003A862A61
MIKLYGLRMSNYYGLTKALLIEKGIDFEEVKAPPSQEEDYLARSPMGKMPSIEVDGQFLSESIAIFNYLEQLVPGLLPKDSFAAAKAMELVCHLKLDVELVARRCLPELLFNKPVSDETKKEVSRDLVKGMKAVNRLAVCDPYACGSELSIADFYVFFCLGLATRLAEVAGVELMKDSPELVALLQRLSDHPSIAQVTAEAAI